MSGKKAPAADAAVRRAHGPERVEGVVRGKGLRRTFAVLAKSRAPGAQEVLLAGLAEDDVAIQMEAARAILREERRSAIPQLVEAFASLAPEVAEDLVRRIDDFIFPLRELLTGGGVGTRRNVIEIILRADRVKLAYLLVQALGDADETIRLRALEGLKRLAEGYHREAELARSGEIDLSRSEMETHKFALLDPILGLLGNLSRPQPDELLQLAMGLDVRANDLLFAILASRQDPRQMKIVEIVWNASSPQAISFILDALRDPRAARTAVSVLQQRRDLPFVRGLLSSHRFYTDYRVRDRLLEVTVLDFPEAAREGKSPGEGPVEARTDLFADAPLALRAIHFLVLAGVSDDRRRELLAKVNAMAEAPLFVRSLAENVVHALERGRHRREISLALVHLENLMGIGPGSEVKQAPGMPTSQLDMPELELPWAHPDAESLPQDAFEQFFNTYDTLDEATRLLAVAILRRLDPEHLKRVETELASLDAVRRLKAVKIVVMLHREQDVEETLLKLATDPNRHVRATVVRTLGILEDQKAIQALLGAATDIDRRVVANSVEALEDAGHEELLGLVNIFAEHPNNRIRANAVRALWRMGEPHAGTLLEEMLRSDDTMMRLSATWLLGEIDYPRRIERLVSISKEDDDAWVRQKALKILGEMG